MSIAQPLPSPNSSIEYRIPFLHSVWVPLLFGPMRGQYWLPFSRGKLLRLLLGRYEPDQTIMIASRLGPGCVLFDVGAAVGYYTVLASPLVGSEGRVVAFEPDAKNAAYLRRHVAINRLSNVEVHQTAIGNRNGVTHFSGGSGTGSGHLTHSGDTTVSIRRLDDVIGRTNVPTHIKIDVEGAELDVLVGARHILAHARPILFLSTHGPTVHRPCCRFLRELGYQIQPMSPNPKYESEILCVPRTPNSKHLPLQKRRAA